MIISKLNRFTDRHGKAAIIIIALLIVIPFVFMWGPNSVFDRSGERRLTHAGEIYGRKIPIGEMVRLVRFAQLDVMRNQQQPLNLGETRVVEFLVDQALQRVQALREAKARKLDTVSEEQIDDMIRRSFSVDGAFDRDSYMMFSELMLRPMGLDEQDFREFVRQDIILGRVYSEVLSGVFVTPLEVEEQLLKNHQKFSVAYRAFERSDFIAAAESELASEEAVAQALAALKDANPDGAQEIDRDDAVDEVLEAQAREFFESSIEPLRPWIDGTYGLDEVSSRYAAAFDAENAVSDKPTPIAPDEFGDRLNRLVRPLYESPTKRLVVASIPVSAFHDKVGEINQEDVRARYDEKAEDYQRRVRARHILIRADESNDAEAREKIADILEQLEGGADFAELAKQYSEDPGSAVRGGELGTFGRGRMVKPFEEAAFALEEGEVSGGVKTDFGYHIIRVDKVIPERSFDEVRFELVAELTKERARRFAWNAAEDLSYKVFEHADQWSKASFKVLAQTAAEAGYTVKTTDFFSPNGEYPELFGDSRAAARKAYGVTENQPLSEAVEGEDAYFVAALVESRPGRLTELDDEALAFCRNIVVNDKALELARAAAASVHDEIVAELPESDASPFLQVSYEFESPEPFTRLNPPTRDVVGWTVLGQLSEQPSGTLSEPLDIPEGAVLVYIDQRLPLDSQALSEEDREVASEQVRRQKSQAAVEAFHERLTAESEPELVEGLAEMLSSVLKR